MSIGQNIKTARSAANLTQKELGTLIGVSFQAIAQWENNLRTPKLETVVKIADALNVNPADIDERLVLNLGSDVIYTDEDGNKLVLDSESHLGKAAAILQVLTEEGKNVAVGRMAEVAEIPKYRK